MAADFGPSPGVPATLLCVCNFPSNTGFAWDFIEKLYGGIANSLTDDGVRTLVAYPHIVDMPRVLGGTAAVPVELDTAPSSGRALWHLLAFIRRENVQVLYLADRESSSPLFPLLRSWGVRHIIVHDHASGDRRTARGIRRLAKWGFARLPGVTANCVITVSDFVARRQREVSLVPAARVIRVWNGVAIPSESERVRVLRRLLGVDGSRTVVACCCRAHPTKGVAHLLRAFDRVCAVMSAAQRPILVYIGDGPELEELERVRRALPCAEDIRFLGYIPEASRLLAEADVCVSASVWQEAFGLAVLEPMAHGRAVVATAVGGVPEIVEEGISGILVPPSDEGAMASEIVRLLRDPELRARMGAAARKRASTHFSIEAQIRSLSALAARGFALSSPGRNEPAKSDDMQILDGSGLP